MLTGTDCPLGLSGDDKALGDSDADRETFAPHSQSITFGLNNHALFFNALLGLVRDRRERLVQVAIWRDDWESIRDPRCYLLLSVARREDMGVLGLVIEEAPGYAFLQPCTHMGIPLPDAVSIIVPTTRIARLHVPRVGEQWSSRFAQQPVDQPQPAPSVASGPRSPTLLKRRLRQEPKRMKSRHAMAGPSPRMRWRSGPAGASTSTGSASDETEIVTLVDWVYSLPVDPSASSSAATATDRGWAPPERVA